MTRQEVAGILLGRNLPKSRFKPFMIVGVYGTLVVAATAFLWPHLPEWAFLAIFALFFVLLACSGVGTVGVLCAMRQLKRKN